MEPLSGLLTVWLGTMFVYSAGLKFTRYDRAHSLLAPYRILPRRLAAAAGLALPWAELLAGLLLLLDLLAPGGPLLSLFLGASFAYAAASALLRRAKVPCGCTGSDRDAVGRATLLRALTIVASSSLLLVLAPAKIPLIGATALCVIATAPSVWLAFERRRVRQMYGYRHRHVEVTPDELKRLRTLLDLPSPATADGSA